jgi:hypothetical protein
MKRVYVLLAVVSLLVAAAGAQGQVEKGKYRFIEVVRFDNAAGVEFPADRQVTLVEDLVKQLEGTKKFEPVLRSGEKPSNTSAAVVRLTGTITQYKPGSRAARYLIGPGVGTTKVVAQIKLVDASTGAVVLERKVDGKVMMGIMGGNSAGATNGLAKEVAKALKGQLF